jgi:hypothetical protein
VGSGGSQAMGGRAAGASPTVVGAAPVGDRPRGGRPCLLEQPGILVEMTLPPPAAASFASAPPAGGRATRSVPLPVFLSGVAASVAVFFVVAAAAIEHERASGGVADGGAALERYWWWMGTAAGACWVAAFASGRRLRLLLAAFAAAALGTLGLVAAWTGGLAAVGPLVGCGWAGALGAAVGLWPRRPCRAIVAWGGIVLAVAAAAVIAAVLPAVVGAGWVAAGAASGALRLELAAAVAVAVTVGLLLAAVAADDGGAADRGAVDRGEGAPTRLGPVFALVLAGASVVVTGMLAAHALPGAAGGLELSAFVAVTAAAVVVARPFVLVGALGAAAVFAVLDAPRGADAHDAWRVVELARRARVAVNYVRATQEVQLTVDGEVVAAAGPDRTEIPLAAALTALWLEPGDRVQFVGAGTGHLARCLSLAAPCDVEAIEPFGEVHELRHRLLADGPVEPPAGAPKVAWPRKTPFGFGALPDGARQAVVVPGLPAAATAHRLDERFQRQLRRLAGDGVVVHVAAVERLDAGLLRRLLLGLVAAHPWNGAFLVGDGLVLVGATRALPLAVEFDALPRAHRWTFHEAHVGNRADVERAFVGALDPAAVRRLAEPEPGARGRRAVIEVLAGAIATPPAPVPAAEDSVSLRWALLRSEVAAAAQRIERLGDDAAARSEAQRIAASLLAVGAPAAPLQAALGLEDQDGVRLCDPALATRRAHAIDPTFVLERPRVLAAMPLPRHDRGALEDLHVLPEPSRLVRLASGEDPLARALRIRFPSACASAFVLLLEHGPLDAAAAQALRELADPFVLGEAARVLLPHDRARELLAFWRLGLPMPAGLGDALMATPEDRRLLAAALFGRRDAGSLDAVAALLVADDLEVRHLAAAALRQAVGDLVPYDPEGPLSSWRDAAQRLRSLHNRPQ